MRFLHKLKGYFFFKLGKTFGIQFNTIYIISYQPGSSVFVSIVILAKDIQVEIICFSIQKISDRF